jgi:hypothetical protein
MRIDDAGTWDNVYTTDSSDTGLIYLKPGTTIDGVQGIMYFSFNNWKLEPRDEDDFDNVVTAIEFMPSVASDVTLHQNYPNPFRAESGTTISFDLPRQAQVSLRLYDMGGRMVASLLEGTQLAGSYNVRTALSALPAGTYIYRLLVDGAAQSARMTIIR